MGLGKDIPESEQQLRQAVDAERTLWENAIILAARKAEVDYLGLSAGQILKEMSDELCKLKGLGPYRNDYRDEGDEPEVEK